METNEGDATGLRRRGTTIAVAHTLSNLKTGARERSGVALVLVSAVCFAALGVLTQLAYRAGVSVLGLICGRYLIAAAALWVLVRVLRRPLPSRRGVNRPPKTRRPPHSQDPPGRGERYAPHPPPS